MVAGEEPALLLELWGLSPSLLCQRPAPVAVYLEQILDLAVRIAELATCLCSYGFDMTPRDYEAVAARLCPNTRLVHAGRVELVGWQSPFQNSRASSPNGLRDVAMALAVLIWT